MTKFLLSALLTEDGESEIQTTARHAIHLQFDINANALEIRAAQSPKCIIRCAVDFTLEQKECGFIKSA
jgi:hypothetical protein